MMLRIRPLILKFERIYDWNVSTIIIVKVICTYYFPMRIRDGGCAIEKFYCMFNVILAYSCDMYHNSGHKQNIHCTFITDSCFDCRRFCVCFHEPTSSFHKLAKRGTGAYPISQCCLANTHEFSATVITCGICTHSQLRRMSREHPMIHICVFSDCVLWRNYWRSENVCLSASIVHTRNESTHEYG